MSKNAVNRVKDAVGTITEKIERASETVVTELHETADATIQKFDKVKKVLITPLQEANAMLDELLFGDNGAPADDEEVLDLGPATFLPKAEDGAVSDRSGAATAAKPEPSKLAQPVPLPDWVKK
jgi:hypothetical protein